MSAQKTVKRVLAPGKRFSTIVDKERVTLVGKKDERVTVNVTEAQAKAFETHWAVQPAKVVEPEGDGGATDPAKKQGS